MISTRVTARIRFAYRDGTLGEDHYLTITAAHRNVHHYPTYHGITAWAEPMEPRCTHGELAGDCMVTEYRPDAYGGSDCWSRDGWWRSNVYVPTARCIHNPESILDEEYAS